MNAKLRCHLEWISWILDGRSVGGPNGSLLASIFRQSKNPKGLLRA